jgi:glycosyltransferase involved in cell wall biosynthesis
VTDGRNGVLLPAPPSSEAIAAGLERMLLDPDLRARLGAEARACYEREFSAERWAVRLRSLYDAVLSDRAGITKRRAAVESSGATADYRG